MKKGGKIEEEYYCLQKTANSPFLNIRRSSGAVPFVRNCAPMDAQEKFGGTLGTFQRKFRSGKMEKMGQICAERYKKRRGLHRLTRFLYSIVYN